MTTAGDNLALRETGKAVEPESVPAPALRGDARTCASSVPVPPVVPSPDALLPVTESIRTAASAASAAGAKAAELLDKPGSLVHRQLPTLARARELHHERARRHQSAALTSAHLAYGYLHLLTVKPFLNFLEWVTETPLRLAGAAALAALIILLWR